MKFIQNLSIRNKLLLITLIPLAATLYFLSTSAWSEIRKRNNTQQVYKEVMEIEKISDIIHNVQEERSYSITYMATHGREEKTELFNQRIQTDKSIEALNQLLRKQGREKFFGFLDSIPIIRNDVNGLQAPVDSMALLFLDINTRLTDEVNNIYRTALDPQIRNLLEIHVFLLYGKIYLSRLRMMLQLAILSGRFRNHQFAEFASLKGRYEAKLERFYKNAPRELLKEYNGKMADPSIVYAKALMDSVFNDPSLVAHIPVNTWKVNMTIFLNELKELEDLSTLQTRQLAEQRLADITRSLIQNIVLAIVVIVVIAVLLVATIRSMSGSVKTLKEVADRMTAGDMNLTVPIAGRDEIGDLATSFNRMIQVTSEYARNAEAIGRGDYTPVINVRGDTDTLGNALYNMKNNLQRLSHENEMRTWLLTGSAELNDKIRGEKDVLQLSQEVICHITPFLKAQVGAIYLAENEQLALTGSYAFYQRKGNLNVIEKGQGLVGQAALEKKPIIFDEVPDDYIKISSGIGSVSPRHILVYPFLYEGDVKGVIELGTTHDLSELTMQFLDMVSENIGIALNTSQSRARLKTLLEETQHQSEELAAQQEELRQVNEELQEKTQLLERSEAELKAQQEELQQTNEELEEKANLLEEQKEKLEIAKMEVETKARELEATSKYKSEFLANMSHELRTPLNSILILAQLLTENKNKSLTPRDIEFAKNIHNSGTDLLNLINEILDLSKVEAGRVEIEVEEVNINNLQQHLHQLFNEIAKNKHIGFNIQYQKEHFTVPLLTDKQRLEQILRNLLSNAFKFTEQDGKVELYIDVLPPDRAIRNPRLKNLPRVAVFTVSDTGIGIPESKQGIVFEAFQQADGSTKRKYGGTGLGLSISRELATALGGEIHLYSREGKGSVFTLYLPLQFDVSIVDTSEKEITLRKSAGKPVPASNKEPLADMHKEADDDRYTISENDKVLLIVEDDESFAKILLDIARQKGYKVVVAHQGNTGLSLARYYRPDAIILDMKLPVLDGSEVLRQLKNDPNLRHIPVQIMSGYDRRKEGLELGAFDYMRKPLSREGVQEAFDRIQEFINRELKKLLVVEDNREQNKAIRELIGNGDVKSFAAYTGEEAYMKLLNEKFDCIIIDLGLPDMSGFDLLEKIKVNDNLNRIPVIVYTARDMNKDEVRRLEKLASTVVLKTTDSTERLLDETALFLHRVESKLPKEKQQIIRKLHRTEDILKNKKVLIVDDDMRNTYSLTNVLDEEGMTCYTAENGRSAIESLKRHPDTDIVLMDVMMPEMDGYEATQAIREMDTFNKLPIIALTAKAMKGDREKCLEAGMSDYIAKPVNIEQLLSLMRVWLYK